MDKRGQLGLDLAKQVILAFVIIIVLAVAGILAVVSLRDANIFSAGSSEANQTSDIIGNYTAGVSGFFSNTGTIFTILFVVVIISAIAVVIVVVNRFGGGRSAGL